MINQHNGNIIINRIASGTIKEAIPYMPNHDNLYLTLNKDKELRWNQDIKYSFNEGLSVTNTNGLLCIDVSIDNRVIINEKIKDTNIHYKNGRIGLGRAPMYSYMFDIGVPENSITTAFHIGDGKYGFSMGNGTSQGFIPEIIGMGSDENDAGLYLIGRAGNDISSNIPLIIIDGRNHIHKEVTNRPIFGITNSKYAEYDFLVNNKGQVGIGMAPQIYKLEVEGKIKALDFILDTSISFSDLVEIIIEQKHEIDILKDKLTELENIIK